MMLPNKGGVSQVAKSEEWQFQDYGGIAMNYIDLSGEWKLRCNFLDVGADRFRY